MHALRGEARMKYDHIVYFYKFIIKGFSSADLLMKRFNKQNSKDNSLLLRKNYVLFIADKKIDNYRINGRLLKINVGLFRRIDIDNGKEWLDEIKKNNGIEFETYVFINLNENVMAATYNSEAFGILDKTIKNYFYDILKIKDKVDIRIEPLALPDAIKKLLNSKNIQKMEFKLAGEEVREILDAIGEGPKGIILGEKNEPIITLSISVTYKEGEKPLSSFREFIEYFKKHHPMKSNNTYKKKAIIETETGYYSLIQPTLLNDIIKYDDQSEDDINNKIFDELSSSIDRKMDDIKNAIEISEKEILDNYP